MTGNANKFYYICITFFLTCMLLGFMATFQLRSNNQVQGIPYDRVQQLTVELNDLTKGNAKLETEAMDLEQKINQVKGGKIGAAQALAAELNKTEEEAGLTPLEGTGIKIVLNNVTTQSNNENPVYIIKDEDLLNLINNLNASGAEAISINGQRIVATSEVRLAGSNIDVNLVPITPPYTILAIGDPEQLKSGLEIAGGLVLFLQDLGITVTVDEENSVIVPAYKGTLTFKYAQSVLPEPSGQ